MWVDAIIIVLLLVDCAVNLILWRKLQDRPFEPISEMPVPLGPARVRRQPFAKPSGKRKPKVNDDTAMAIREREKR